MVFEPLGETRQASLPCDEGAFTLGEVAGLLVTESRREGIVENGKDSQALGGGHLTKKLGVLGSDLVPLLAEPLQVIHRVIIPIGLQRWRPASLSDQEICFRGGSLCGHLVGYGNDQGAVSRDEILSGMTDMMLLLSGLPSVALSRRPSEG